MKKTMTAYPYAVWAVLFTVIPLAMIVGYSLFYANGEFGFSLESIKKCFDPLYLKIIGNSFWMAFVCTVICLVVGYPIALILAGNTFKQKNKGVLLFLTVAPMWMNFLLRTYAWLTILENNGLVNKLLGLIGIEPVQFLYTTGTVIMGMVYNFLPFMILPIYSIMSKMDHNIIDAANDLCATKGNIFRRITLPLSMPGVFSGVMMVFMPAVTTFVITRLLGGGQTTMIGNVIEDQFVTAYDWGFGSSLSVILMAIILVCIAITNKYDLEVEGGGLF